MFTYNLRISLIIWFKRFYNITENDITMKIKIHEGYNIYLQKGGFEN